MREELLTDKRSPEDFLAVRVDQLLEEGWEEPRGDSGMLRALAHAEPWSSWLAAAADKQRLAELWSAWAPEPHLARIIGAVTRIVPFLTALHVGFFPLRPPDLRRAWKTGWLRHGPNVDDGAYVAEGIALTYAATRRAGW